MLNPIEKFKRSILHLNRIPAKNVSSIETFYFQFFSYIEITHPCKKCQLHRDILFRAKNVSSIETFYFQFFSYIETPIPAKNVSSIETDNAERHTGFRIRNLGNILFDLIQWHEHASQIIVIEQKQKIMPFNSTDSLTHSPNGMPTN